MSGTVGNSCLQVLQVSHPSRNSLIVCRASSWQALHATHPGGMVTISGMKSATGFVASHLQHCRCVACCKQGRQRWRLAGGCCCRSTSSSSSSASWSPSCSCGSCARGKASATLFHLHWSHWIFLLAFGNLRFLTFLAPSLHDMQSGGRLRLACSHCSLSKKLMARTSPQCLHVAEGARVSW